MAFEAIAVRQSKPFTVNGEDGTFDVTLDAAVAAGSALVVVGTSLRSDTTQTTLLSSVADGTNTWSTPVNVRSAGSYSPNAFAALAENVSAGSTTVTLSVNQSTAVRASGVLIEVEKGLTSGILFGTVLTGTGTGTSSTSTSASGTLDQTDNLLILCGGGWCGLPSNPSGWTSLLTQQNDATYIGCQVSHKTTSTTDSVTGTVPHAATGGATSAVMLILEAATAGAALQYRFSLDPATFTSADTGVTGYVWRNSGPDGVLAEKYESLAGDAGSVVITGVPADVALGDTIVGSFYNSTDGSRPFAAGVVETA